MFLSDSQDVFRAAEIAAQNAAPADPSRASFRASEILVQNQTEAPKSRLLMAGVALVVLYYFFSRKG
jgi:hypothetical protein